MNDPKLAEAVVLDQFKILLEIGSDDALAHFLTAHRASVLAALREAQAEIERLVKLWNEEMENTARWKLRAEKTEAALAAERERRERMEKRAEEAEAEREAALKRVELKERLLRDIADDATDGPINRGLNSVQAVLAWREALRSTPAPEDPRIVADRRRLAEGVHTPDGPPAAPPDLPLGHEFIQQSDLCAECAKPESAHRRK